jgi:hypothetical protein
MKRKGLALLIASLLLVAVATAQEYSIRANRGLNLRAAPELNADIAATVRSGAILQVVGESGHWLQIQWPGSVVWLANWVSFSRLDNGVEKPAQPETIAPTDNCCFVDRLCDSDQEWTDGYWAYQNGQCAAPAQSYSGTSALPAGSMSSSIDNCCFAGWRCGSDQEWVNGYWAYQNNLCDASSASRTGSVDSCCQLGWNCTFDFDWIIGKWAYDDTGGQCGMPIQEVVDGVIIEGSNAFVAKIKSAMNLVKGGSPEWYAYSINGARKIREFPWTAGNGTLEQSYNLTTGFVASNSRAYLAAVFVHENCHIQRWLNGFDRGELEHLAEEAVCDTVAINALKVFAPGASYPRDRINEFLNLGLPYDVDASAHREWERARALYSQTS